MLSNSSLSLANLYADALYVNGQIVVPSLFEGDLHEAISLIPEDVVNALADPANIPMVADHLIQMEELYDPIVDRWVTELDAAIALLTTTVAPVYTEYLEQSSAALQDMEVVSEASSYYVEMVGVPTWFLQSSAWFNDQNKGTTPSFQALPELRFNPLSSRSHLEVLKQLCKAADGEVWLNRVIHTRMPALAATFDGLGSSTFLNAKFSEQNPFDRVNDAVMLLLMTRIMADTPPVELSINVAAYNLYLRNVKLLAQSIITKTLPLMTIYERQQKLVINTDPGMKRIRVVSTVYDTAYVPQGGSIDALLGLLVSSDGARNVEDILANQKRYMEVWLTYTSQSKLNSTSIRLAQSKRILRRLIDTMRVTEYEVAAHGVLAGTILPEHVRTQMFDFINEMTINDIENLEMSIAKVIGQGRFFGTPAYNFLVDMITAKVANTHEVAETAMYAAIRNYIARYLVQNIEVKKV